VRPSWVQRDRWRQQRAVVKNGAPAKTSPAAGGHERHH